MKRKRFRIYIPILCALLAAGCGDRNDGSFVGGRYHYPDGAKQEEAAGVTEAGESGGQDEGENVPGPELFLITSNDMKEECLILEQLASGKQYMYYYTLATQFLDKYGNRTTVSCFDPGRIITIGEKDPKGKVLKVQISDEVWEYPDVTRYSVDEERGVFAIADTKYSYDESLFVNSDGKSQELSELTSLDTLRVIGKGRKILSISVTTGHGALKLTNTELFDGSFIQIGDSIFSEITGPMTLDIAEGTYLVTVANDGYGGSTEVEIRRGEEFTLDLDTLKGEGPKYGNILFAVDVLGAVLQIDGQVVDYSEVIPLKYGIHTITVTADSYEPYTKKLFVNSEEATIVIGLTGEDFTSGGEKQESEEKGEESESATQAASTGKGKAGSLAGSRAGNRTGGNGTGNGTGTGNADNSLDNITDQAELDAVVDGLLDDEEESSADYLSTIGKLLKLFIDKN